MISVSVRSCSLGCWREVLLRYGINLKKRWQTHLEYFCRSSYVATVIFMIITAAVLAEICSALPLSGSIYVWAAESAGPKYARFFGFLVAWWACTAWMTFTASNCQVSLAFVQREIRLEVFFLTDHGQLHCFPIGCLGNRLPWRS